MKKLQKGAFCTDIHFGKKSNSPVHNEDCVNYIKWFCDQVRNDPSIDYIGFLGDWNENRSAINIATFNYSYYAARMLNELGLPVFFVVGNHDLYHRNSRDIHSIVPFSDFSNFAVIDHPTVINDIHGGALFSPYLFHEEYDNLDEYLKLPFWAGHFEFKGFKITGYNVIMPSGPDPQKFVGPDRILSGHFHQRQTQGNITYIGNTFPMDFGDAGDTARGLATYNHKTKQLKFVDWPDCPQYIRVKLSTMLNPSYTLPPQARVKCVVDTELSFEEFSVVREEYMSTYNLRELTFEETGEIDDIIANTIVSTDNEDADVTANIQLISQYTDASKLVLQMLQEINSDKIDTDLLVQQYLRLQ